MLTVGLTDAEHTALAALIKRAIEQDRFPNAPRLDPLRSALAKLDPAAAAALRRPLAAKKAEPGVPGPKPPKGRPRASYIRRADGANGRSGRRPARVSSPGSLARLRGRARADRGVGPELRLRLQPAYDSRNQPDADLGGLVGLKLGRHPAQKLVAPGIGHGRGGELHRGEFFISKADGHGLLSG
jgi:hypothetical protein